ncbi:MAG: tetratricopeptide repeat protein [Deltaproteobacteria bacterium]|nr:tetratricopeptide repeat protein [Deltaproteobacteria bacterium]MBN2670618.1 tetratricopeptide repeat protein [Deltaproteobacteria bacterium]
MKPKRKECKYTLPQLARFNELSAVARSRVEMHLRRCESCQSAWQDLEQIEQLRFNEEEFTSERKDAIYDRLVPSIYEISNEVTQSNATISWWKPVVAASVGIAAAAAVVFAILVYQQPQDHTIASFSISPPVEPAVAPTGPDLSKGRIDKMQGIVYMDGKPFSGMDGSLKLVDGTRVAVAEDSKLNFRMGRFVKVALVDETSWSINKITPELISLSLERGKLAVEYDGSLGRRMEIHTPETTVLVKGTIFTVEVFGDGATQVSVTRGKVQVISNDSTHSSIDVASGELIQVPGTDRAVELGDRQRILAAEVESLSDNLVTTSGRLVRFDGGQEHVQVEIEDQIVGFTPLTVRLPAGPVSYRLSKPGMQSVEAQLVNEQTSEQVRFTLHPSTDYVPRVAHMGGKKHGRKAAPALNSDAVPDEESRNFVVRAKAAMSAGDLPYAAHLLEETTRRVSGEQLITALSLLAECYAAMGNYKQAADTFDRVASLVPGTAIAQNSKYEEGRLAMDYIGDYDRARAAFTAYVAEPAVGQLQEDAYFSLCELYGREGVRKNALQCFNEFLRMFPDGHRNSYAHLWRGVLHQEVDQDWRLAERDLLTFIHAKPRHPRCEEARYRIALGRYNIGDFQGAMMMFQEYQEEHPGGQYSIRVERLKQSLWDKMRKKSSKK